MSGKPTGWNHPFAYYQDKPWHISCLEIVVDRNLNPKK